MYALRRMRQAPAFSALAVLTLAIAIGSTTGIVSLVNAVVRRVLPVERPQELRQIGWTSKQDGFAHDFRGGGINIDATGSHAKDVVAYPIYEALKRQSTSFAGIFCSTFEGVDLRAAGQTDDVRVQFVSETYFSDLGVKPAIGRTFTATDNQEGGPFVAVVSDAFWRRRFNGNPGVLGQPLAVNGITATIVGVTPPSFFGIDPGTPTDVVLPVVLQSPVTGRRGTLQDPYAWQFQLFARLKPGVGDEAARAETEMIVDRMIQSVPQDRAYDLPRVWLVDRSGGLENLRVSVMPSLQMLMPVAGLTLLIACANIAGLLLARGRSRPQEIATRLAIGASRGQVVRQLLGESLALSAFGGAGGLAIAFALPGVLLAGFRRGNAFTAIDVTPDFGVFAICAALSIAVAIGFGLLPALQSTRVDLLSALKLGAGNSSSRRSRFGLGKAAVTIQVAVCMILLTAAGLLIRTVSNLDSTPMGFDASDVLTFQLNPQRVGLRGARVMDVYEGIATRIQSIPGVESASMSDNGILTDSESGAKVRLPGESETFERPDVRLQSVGPHFFETMRITTLAGRDFAWRDRQVPVTPVVLNESLARQLFPKEEAVGGTVYLNVLGGREPSEVVGVVADAKYNDLRGDPPPTVYMSFVHENPGSMIFVVRSHLPAATLAADIRDAVRALDPNVAITALRTQQAYIDRKMSKETMLAHSLSAFGIVSLLLACLGIYGVLAYSVAQRTREIGIRVALGAKRSDVVGFIAAECAGSVSIGVVFGAAGAVAANRIVAGVLFGVAANDPMTMVAGAAVLIVGATVAAFIPARRASMIRPAEALRHD